MLNQIKQNRKDSLRLMLFAFISIALSSSVSSVAQIQSAVYKTAAYRTAATGRPMIIAHRGGAMESTEHTIAAFQRAARIGAAGIETDIRLTRDGVVVVYHDDYFGRVEGLAPMQRTRLISDMNYSDLSAQTLMPVGEHTGGRRVPTLSDLLARVRSGLLNIELKRCARFDDLVDKTIVILKGFAEL